MPANSSQVSHLQSLYAQKEGRNLQRNVMTIQVLAAAALISDKFDNVRLLKSF